MNQELFDQYQFGSERIYASPRSISAPFKITLEQFNSIVGSNKVQDANSIVNKLNEVFEKYQIDSYLRVCHFMAQLCCESGGFTARVENLNYSATRLLQVFPKYFTTSSASQYVGSPERIANKVYANRGGNGSELSGDGWRYRGRGFIQITLKDNYSKIGKFLEYDFVSKPDDLTKTSCSVYSAAAYWTMCNINRWADKDDINGVTKAVNGGYNGLDIRMKYLTKCKQVLK